MADKYAYRASPELNTALVDLAEQISAFAEATIQPWHDQHGVVVAVWRYRLGYELVCIGFVLAEGQDTLPAGLSASRDRDWLIPKRGRSGEPWRQAMELLNQRPKLGPVLERFQVDPVIEAFDQGRIYHMGLHDTPDGYYVTWGAEHPSPGPHLTPVPLSVFYAAKERAAETTPATVR